ncbi:unnamed protein product [Caenorhabditis angaria]|uniref:Uncharacterized protein n=1 Tax=Caenorhabditis angaria TaxID=860376 RepID=A0A9P1I7B7_9PELO|nr:unnamed protein product [Caenorhabditis angaria]
MGTLLTISCYIFTFSPSFCIFCRFIAHDPVRIILFFLGSFFWLVSILFSSLIWLLLSQILPKPQSFFLAISTSILIQESSRIAYFLLLKAAQSGLNKITKQGQISVAPGVSDLQNSRHMLGLVCGLGMGVISALFLTMNAFAAFSGPGTIGMPEALLKSTVDVNRAGKYLPAFYSASALLLSCFHVCWTIMIWDSCHRFGRMPTAYLPGFAALITHFAVAYLDS